MKYYVDYNNGQIKIDVEKEFYQSENLENKITVLLTNVADPEDEVVPAYFLSIEFLRSDGRKCTIQTADAFGEEEDTTLTEDDVTYDIHNFTLTEQVLKCAGTLMFTVYINFVNSDTGNVIKRGVLLNGVNNVKKTVPYSTNSLLVLDDEEEAETTVTNILDELTKINAALATKQKKLVLQYDSGLTMTDSYKLKVKLWESGGLSVDNLGVKINYSYDDFQIAKTPNYENKKIMKLNYFYNTAPVNKSSVYVSNGGTPTGTSSLFMNNLTVTSTSISQIGAWQVEGTKYTYTFSGQTAKCIAKNDNHPYEFLTYYATDTNMTNSYSLALDTTNSVCKQLLQDFINFAGRKYTHFMNSVTIPTGAVVIFKPIGKVSDVIYFSCENFMCTKTEVNDVTNNPASKIVLVNIILGLAKDGNNYKVEFEVENSTGKVFTASNSKIYMPTELLKSVRATALYNSEQELLYKFLEEENDSFDHEIIRIDTEPVDGSTHLIESGAVKSAIDDVENALNADIEASGHTIELALDSTNYKITAVLKDANGNTISTSTAIDLPLESVVVSGAYDDTTKKVVLTLQNGSTIEFSVADLVSGLQSEITSANKLDADLVDDTNSTNKFVSASEKQDISNLKTGTDDTNVITITKTYNVALEDAMLTWFTTPLNITGYVSQADYSRINKNTILLLKLEFTDRTLVHPLNVESYNYQNSQVQAISWSFRNANLSATNGGIVEIYGSIDSDREYTFILSASEVYTEGEVDALLASKQDTISGSTSIDITSNVVSVKDSYVEDFFATSQEIDNMLEEVFG